MRFRGLIALGTAAVLGAAVAAAQPVFDPAKYPDWKGQWLRTGRGARQCVDPPSRSGSASGAADGEIPGDLRGRRQDEADGGQGIDPTYLCVPSGMPSGMIAVLPMEIIVTPETTYVALELFNMRRRIDTDGRDFPANLKPSFAGYSTGHWEDRKGSGRYDQLVAETRGLKGPHTDDSSGVPFHEDEQAVITERLYSDQNDPNILHNEVTTIDHALTRPWTVTRSYHREARPQPLWTETYCTEDNHHVFIGGRNYIVSGDGYLMPARKDEPPPDLRNFQAAK